MITSCSPAWIKYAEQFHPEILPNISSCKSPMSMMSSVLKTYFAKKKGIDPKDILSVAVMPCTAKKYEAQREELQLDVAIQLEGALLAVFHRLDDLRFVAVGIEGQRDESDRAGTQRHRAADRPQAVLEISVHIVTHRKGQVGL